MRSPAFLLPALALSLALAACKPGVQPPTGTSPTRGPGVAATAKPAPGVVAPGTAGTPAPRPTLAPGTIAHLSGVVRLLGNNSAGIISDNGGGVVSNAGGSIVSHGEADPAGHNAAAYGLAQAAALPEWRLADADVEVVDAAGAPAKGAGGEPLAARTDGRGAFRIEGALPPGNHVLRVKLWNGGTLQALLVPGAEATIVQDVDTASSIGAAYVLERLVKGQQAVYDRLSPTEARRLDADVEAARGLVAGAPTYEPARLAETAEGLRRQAPAVDRTLQTIEALLLGQAVLGDGRRATEVPLNRPKEVVVSRDGTVLVDEYGMGRLRTLSAGGFIGTRLDGMRGTLRRNVRGMKDFLEGPDGTLYLASLEDLAVYKASPDGTFKTLVGAGGYTSLAPNALALGPDGTLYVGESEGKVPTFAAPPRLIAIAPDGTVRTLPAMDGDVGAIRALELGPDGMLYVLSWAALKHPQGGRIYKLAPNGGSPQLVADKLGVGADPDLAFAPDGSLWVTADHAGQLLRLAADGGPGVAPTVVPGPVAEPFLRPGGIAFAADGSLYVCDVLANLVQKRAPDGTWAVVAGTTAGVVAADGSLAFNTPSAAAYDAQGRLLIVEAGRDRILRYANGALTPFAGTFEGFGGDGGPALAAKFRELSGMVVRGDEVLVLDPGNGRLRKIDGAGVVTSIAGGAAMTPGGTALPAPADAVDLSQAIGLAASATSVFWTSAVRDDVERLGPDGTVTRLAGRGYDAAGVSFTAMAGDPIVDGEPAATAIIRGPLGMLREPSGDLLIGDAGHGLIRRIKDPEGAAPTIATVAGGGLPALARLALDPGAVAATERAADAAFVIPAGLARDAAGNLYVGELGSRRLDLLGGDFSQRLLSDTSSLPALPARIRKIQPDGTVTTIAGPGGKFFTDPDADDALVLPTALLVTPEGGLLIVDTGANLVRILPAGSF